MDFQQYIKPELLILIPAMYFIGIALKKSACPDKYIPLILGGIGIILSALWIFGMENIVGIQGIICAAFTSITQGILIAGASVYANQIYIQASKKE